MDGVRLKMFDTYRPETEYFTDEMCFITELRKTVDDPGCSIARARVEPGITTRFHLLKGIMERYVILEGSGMMEVGNDHPFQVNPLDVVTIPADIRQCITNTSNTPLIFVCICTPGFTPDNYMDVDQVVE